MPLLIPTANGALVGDATATEEGGDLQLRTFIGGKVALSDAKQGLRQALIGWQAGISHDDFGSGLQISTHDYRSIPDNLTMPAVAQLQKTTKAYLAVLARHPHALESRAVRTARANQQFREWQR